MVVRTSAFLPLFFRNGTIESDSCSSVRLARIFKFDPDMGTIAPTKGKPSLGQSLVAY